MQHVFMQPSIVTDTGLAIVIILFYLQEVYGSIELLIFFHTGFTSWSTPWHPVAVVVGVPVQDLKLVNETLNCLTAYLKNDLKTQP